MTTKLRIDLVGRIIKNGILKLTYQQHLDLKTLSRCVFGTHAQVSIKLGGFLRVGSGVTFRDFCNIDVAGGSVEIGDNSFFNSYCRIISLGTITIGEDCLFGHNVALYDHDHTHTRSSVPFNKQKMNIGRISIGSNVWIGANSVVTAGVTIGNNIVVGANSVVTKDLSESGVYAGTPAKFVKPL